MIKILNDMMEVLDREIFTKATELLLSNSAKLVDGAPTRQKIKEILPSLKARQKISEKTGKKIYGLNQLIETMLELDESLIVLGYGFVSDKTAGNFYFLKLDNKALGAVIVGR